MASVSSAIVVPAEKHARDRVVVLRDPLLHEVADHDQQDQVERLERRELAPPDDAREQQDEEEGDGCADDDVHQGQTVIVRSMCSTACRRRRGRRRSSGGRRRRVDVELQEEQVVVAGGNVAELERNATVAARLPHRRRLDRVQRHALEPAGVEDDGGVLDLTDRLDVEARLEREPAADALRRVDLQLGARTARRGGRRPLPEGVREAEQEEEREQAAQDPAHERPPFPALEVAVVLQRQPFRGRCHVSWFVGWWSMSYVAGARRRRAASTSVVHRRLPRATASLRLRRRQRQPAEVHRPGSRRRPGRLRPRPRRRRLPTPARTANVRATAMGPAFNRRHG